MIDIELEDRIIRLEKEIDKLSRIIKLMVIRDINNHSDSIVALEQAVARLCVKLLTKE